MVIRYILPFIIAYTITPSFAEEVSVMDNIKSEYSADFMGLAGQVKMNFPERTADSPPDFGMVIIDTSQGVTIADFSMGMNCKTGAINMSGSIPELNSFGDAMKVFAPFAVNPATGEVDFKNFISSLMEEFAMEKLTEETLNYLAYIHYYITGSMSDNPPGDLMMFKSKEYSKCMSQTLISAVEETNSFGFGIWASDNFEAHIGVDPIQLIKSSYCKFKFTGVDVGESERERFNKSKAFVRAIFYKLLNGNFDFRLSQSEQCSQLDEASKAIETLSNGLNKEGIQRAFGGDTHGFDGTRTDVALGSTSVTTFAANAGTEGSIDPQQNNGNDNPAEAKIEGAGGGIISAGSQKTETKFDFITKNIFTPSPLFMDRVDLTVDERYSLFDDTFSAFKKSIHDSDLYMAMTTKSREAVIEMIDKVLTIQQLNHKNLNKLECAINKNMCKDYKHVTNPEYQRVVKHGGAVSKCTKEKKVKDVVVCTQRKAIEDTMYKSLSDASPVSDDKIRLYMNKIISDTMFYYVYVYLQSHYGLIFKEEFSFKGYDSNDDAKGLNKMEYIALKIKALRQAKKISKYWTSPISLSDGNDSLKQDLIDLGVMSNSGEALNRGDFVKIVNRIVKNPQNAGDKTQAVSLSFAPYIYEPLNELQLAKILYYLSDSLHIRKILKDGSPRELSVSIDGFYDYESQYGPIVDSLESSKAVSAINYSTNGVTSPFKPIEINNNMLSQFLYQSTNSSRVLLSIEELNNIVKMVDSFKDFYIKRLLDVYREKYDNVSSMVIDVLNKQKHLNQTRVLDMNYEIKKLSFRMLQRREMLKLLINE